VPSSSKEPSSTKKRPSDRGDSSRHPTVSRSEKQRQQLEEELKRLDRLKAEKEAELRRMSNMALPPSKTVVSKGKVRSTSLSHHTHSHPSSSHHRPAPSSALHHSQRRSAQPAYQQPPRHSQPSSHYRHFNYDEDDYEEEEEGRREYDDEEYDSDMADFIDDGDLDNDGGEVGRAELERTLKLLNPNYDKEKWKAREKAIDINRMHSSSRQVEKEEAMSRRIAMYEDLKEAERGSRRIKE